MSEAADIYEFSAVDNQGRQRALADFRGQVLLIVNTASECGFTPQYKELEILAKDFADQGLVVLGFPCNQFGGQEPGSDSEIAAFCERQFQISFPIFHKIDVNGAQADPLFQWLKSRAPGLLGSREVKWNFTKFLVGRDGRSVTRFAPTTAPKGLVPAIERALKV